MVERISGGTFFFSLLESGLTSCAPSLGHSGFESTAWLLALLLLSLLVPVWCCWVSLGTSMSRRPTDEVASACGGPWETCEMARTELLSRNTKTSEMREQK